MSIPHMQTKSYICTMEKRLKFMTGHRTYNKHNFSLKVRVLLTGAPGALVKESKKGKFELKITLF